MSILVLPYQSRVEVGAASSWGPVFFRMPGRHVLWYLHGEGGGVQRSALTCLEHGAPGVLVFADEESFIYPSHVTTQEPTAPNTRGSDNSLGQNPEKNLRASSIRVSQESPFLP